LASQGYLVIAAADGGGHVSVVGPQSLMFGSYPAKKWDGHFADAFQSGSGLVPHTGTASPKLLYDFPVFVQAGSYTGIVNPGNGFSRKLFTADAQGNFKVHFYLYKPEEEKRP
jgi:hypothetical protein